MKIIEASIADVRKSSIKANAQVEISGGVIITASITNETADDIPLKKGK